MSSQWRPTGGICRKWSITHRLANPASSAATAISASRSRGLGRAAGPAEPGDLQAELQRHRALLLAGGGRGRGHEVGGHDRDRVGRVDGGEALAAQGVAVRRASRPASTTARGRGPAAPGTGCGTGHTAASTSNTTATHGTPASAAASRHRRRRLASVPRVSTTVVSRRRSRRSTTRSSTSNASLEARWSCSPAPTTARRASDDTTWSGRNCAAAHVDLPDPGGPTSTTSVPSARRTRHPRAGAKASSVASTSPSG